MQKIFLTVALGLVLYLPSTILGQSTASSVPPEDLFEVRVVGAVRNGGLFHVDSTVTISGALALAGGPARQGQGNKVWVFRDGKIITTIQGGATLIAASPIRSGDQLFVVWPSAVPERSRIGRNVGLVAALLATTGAIVLAFGGS